MCAECNATGHWPHNCCLRAVEKLTQIDTSRFDPARKPYIATLSEAGTVPALVKDSETVITMRKQGTEMRKDTPNRCADCGAPTRSFLCDRCAEICDQLTQRGEYWFRRIRPAHEPEMAQVSQRGTRSSRMR